MPTAVLDASACLAAFRREPGGDAIAARLQEAAVSAVNWVEVAERALRAGLAADQVRELVGATGVTIVAFDDVQADAAAAFREPTRKLGLSLADRACLALATQLGLPAVTADRAWSKLDLGVEVELIR